MAAKIVPMPPPVQITDEDLEIVEKPAATNAARCRRKGAIEEAAHLGADSRQHRPRADPLYDSALPFSCERDARNSKGFGEKPIAPSRVG